MEILVWKPAQGGTTAATEVLQVSRSPSNRAQGFPPKLNLAVDRPCPLSRSHVHTYVICMYMQEVGDGSIIVCIRSTIAFEYAYSVCT